MGASLNLRPDLYKAAILGVPFVDVLTTMLDDTIPLTTTEVHASPATGACPLADAHGVVSDMVCSDG